MGSGAFGKVHLAWDTEDHRWVALKEFAGSDELGLLRFVIESRIRVEHPHLVRTLAFRLIDDKAILVTELARGGSLRQLMSRHGKLPWQWVAEIVDQLLDALAPLHATGVIHRDLKPANLLLRDAGAARPHLLVGDFGIATWRTVSLTGIGAAIGTPGYLAPEYLDGHSPTPATDLFAVGVLAAELLAGRRLVHMSNSSADIPSDWTHGLPVADDVPAHLAAVLRRLADPDPARRYVDCVQAREALLAAAPPSVRGGEAIASVHAGDLLANLPEGWAVEGPTVGPADALTVVRPPAGSQELTRWVVPRHETKGNTSPRSGDGESTWDRPRKGRRRAAVLLVALLVLGGAGAAVYFATRGASVDGRGTAANSATTTQPAAESGTGTVSPPSVFTAVSAGECSRVDIGRLRTVAGKQQRCQRVPGGGQNWILEPAGGFPAASAPEGSFPGERCGNDGDRAYSPVGHQLRCRGGVWGSA
ncbi:protein kinase-like protein [Herbihabitans rhizosphaerae]|uniref:Protein kinase-like protein n=1 Tax=Herbihabitans rhizosphaerae TaxID=1872711 RepID=A0A4Q7KT21_9PSEU|nr:protein kinase-like protein [Herbihabitans rhizosphaerae]